MVVGAVLLVLAPNLLFMLISSLGQRRMASLEQAVFESNAGLAATYKNQLFFQQRPTSCSKAQEEQVQCLLLSSRRDLQPHLYHYSPAHTSRKAAFFYQPLDLQDPAGLPQEVGAL